MSAAAVIIIKLRPPQLAAMAGNQPFCAALDATAPISAYYEGPEVDKPTHDKLIAIALAMVGTSTTALEAANAALLPLPA